MVPHLLLRLRHDVAMLSWLGVEIVGWSTWHGKDTIKTRHVRYRHWTCQRSSIGEEAIRGDPVCEVELLVDVRFGLRFRNRWRQRLHRRWRRWHSIICLGRGLTIGRVQTTKLLFGSLESLIGFLRQLDLPTPCHDM